LHWHKNNATKKTGIHAKRRRPLKRPQGQRGIHSTDDWPIWRWSQKVKHGKRLPMTMCVQLVFKRLDYLVPRQETFQIPQYMLIENKGTFQTIELLHKCHPISICEELCRSTSNKQ
jgi:hypothetical protein